MKNCKKASTVLFNKLNRLCYFHFSWGPRESFRQFLQCFFRGFLPNCWHFAGIKMSTRLFFLPWICLVRLLAPQCWYVYELQNSPELCGLHGIVVLYPINHASPHLAFLLSSASQLRGPSTMAQQDLKRCWRHHSEPEPHRGSSQIVQTSSWRARCLGNLLSWERRDTAGMCIWTVLPTAQT